MARILDRESVAESITLQPWEDSFLSSPMLSLQRTSLCFYQRTNPLTVNCVSAKRFEYGKDLLEQRCVQLILHHIFYIFCYDPDCLLNLLIANDFLRLAWL